MKVHNKSKNPVQHSYFDENQNLQIITVLPNCVEDVEEKIAKTWIKAGLVVEFVAPEDAKAKEAALLAEIERLKEENAKLQPEAEIKKEEITIDDLKKEADELGITYPKNIGFKKLQEKINLKKAEN